MLRSPTHLGRCLLAALLLSASCVTGVEDDAELYREWSVYMKRILAGGSAHKDYWEESLGWQHAPIVRGLVYGYRISADPVWLRELVRLTDQLFARATRDSGHLGWGDSITGEALLLEPILLFIETVQKTPELKAEFAPKAAEYLGLIDPDMLLKWDALDRWRELLYGAGTYTASITLPHNKNAHVGVTLLAASRVTPSPERRALYLERATKLGRRWQLSLKPKGDHYIWHYWDAAGPWDYDDEGSSRHWTSLEHRGYGSADTQFVSECYQHGLVFSREEVAAHVRTWLQEIWDGDRDNPTYWAFGRFNEKYVHSTIFTYLAEYDETILELWRRRVYANPTGWQAMFGVPHYLWVKQHATGFRAQRYR